MEEFKIGMFINTLEVSESTKKYYGNRIFTDITIEYIGNDIINGQYILCNCPFAKVIYCKDIEFVR